MSDNKVAINEISKHNKDADCWIVVDNVVWDITKFAPEHPGGPGIIYKYAGRDATQAYNEIHAPSIIKNGLPAGSRKGSLDTSTVTEEWSKPLPSSSPASNTAGKSDKPPLDSIVNSHDFEIAARNTATAKTWAFYSSASNDLITRDLNTTLFNRVLLRPRVMRRVASINTSTSLVNHEISFPLFISPAAMARLIHPDGELAMARACMTRNIIQSISTNASYSAEEIVSQPEVKHHPFIFQWYVNKDRVASKKLVNKILKMPNMKGIMVTTDAAAPGKREADERVKADESLQSPMTSTKPKGDKKGGGYGRLMGSFIDPNLCWEDVTFLKEQTRGLPLFLKGIMSADDVRLACDMGLDGVVLSNHGGRNLDTSPPAILVLLEVHRRFPEIIKMHHPRSHSVRQGLTKPFTLLLDGGVRRGSDILKAVCLGAVACGIGRSALYAAGYGQEGVEQLIDILKDEFEVAMKNCGLTSIEEFGPQYINTGDLDALVPKGSDHEYAVGWKSTRSKL